MIVKVDVTAETVGPFTTAELFRRFDVNARRNARSSALIISWLCDRQKRTFKDNITFSGTLIAIAKRKLYHIRYVNKRPV